MANLMHLSNVENLEPAEILAVDIKGCNFTMVNG